MSRALAESVTLMSADLEKVAVHEARALVRGDDECVCKLCRKVRNQSAEVGR